MTDDRRGWHLEKSVSVSHIISTISIALSMLWWANNIDKRVDANTLTNHHQDERFNSFKSDIREDYKAIDNKLDDVLERLSSGR